MWSFPLPTITSLIIIFLDFLYSLLPNFYSDTCNCPPSPDEPATLHLIRTAQTHLLTSPNSSWSSAELLRHPAELHGQQWRRHRWTPCLLPPGVPRHTFKAVCSECSAATSSAATTGIHSASEAGLRDPIAEKKKKWVFSLHHNCYLFKFSKSVIGLLLISRPYVTCALLTTSSSPLAATRQLHQVTSESARRHLLHTAPSYRNPGAHNFDDCLSCLMDIDWNESEWTDYWDNVWWRKCALSNKSWHSAKWAPL